MSSEQNDSTSFTQSSTEPKLCANGCGFFGSPSNMNLCSKCYRDICAEEAQTAVAQAAVEKSFKPSPPPTLSIAEPALVNPSEQVKGNAVSVAPVVVAESSSVGREEEPEQNEPSKPARPNRCLCCKKKVGILGFKCKCGSTFCSEHRYPERHDCSFDFKEAGRGEIAKANPVIKADKLQRF